MLLSDKQLSLKYFSAHFMGVLGQPSFPPITKDRLSRRERKKKKTREIQTMTVKRQIRGGRQTHTHLTDQRSLVTFHKDLRHWLAAVRGLSNVSLTKGALTRLSPGRDRVSNF